MPLFIVPVLHVARPNKDEYQYTLTPITLKRPRAAFFKPLQEKGGRRIRAPLYPQAFERIQAWLTSAGIAEDDTETYLFRPFNRGRRKRDENVGKTATKILDACSKNAYITIPDLTLKMAVTERSIERNIQKLQHDGFLRRACGRKEGHWGVTVSTDS